MEIILTVIVTALVVLFLCELSQVDAGCPSGNLFQNKDETVVFLRQNKGVNCQRWESSVRYDSWGSPYVRDHYGWHIPISIFPGGKTSDNWLYGTEWKHKSGPEVTFGKRPTRPFDME